MNAHAYPYSLRLHLKRDFDRVFQRGQKSVRPDAIVWRLARGDEGPTRLSVVVSGKLGDASRRNRVKRLVRECFRLSRARLRAGFDIVVYPRPGRCRWSGREEARRSLETSWKTAGLWSD